MFEFPVGQTKPQSKDKVLRAVDGLERSQEEQRKRSDGLFNSDDYDALAGHYTTSFRD